MSNKSGSITVVQMTRFGDLLQTIWAVKDLKKQNPNIKVNLVARKKFGEPLKFLLDQYFDNTYLLNPSSFLTEDLTQGIDSTLDAINSWESKVVVNLSFSKTSAYLCNLINADFKLGLVANNFGAVQAMGSWSEFVYSTVMRGALNPFSLVDIFRFILGIKEKPTFPERNVSGKEIVIHPFASIERKSWNMSKWSEVLYSTLKNNPDIQISIVGSKEDLKKAEELRNNPLLASYKDRLSLECGTLSLEQLHKKLSESFLFCGHDSMVGHLASLAGTQSLTLALGSVRADETTPYGINNFVISPKTDCYPCFPTDACDNFKCHKDMSYKVATESLQQLIDSNTISYEKIKENISPLHLSTVDILKTEFKSSGLFSLVNLQEGNQTTKELYRTFYRIVWLYMLEQTEENTSFPQINQISLKQIEAFIPNLKQLFELAEFGKKYSRFILEEVSKDQPDLNYIKDCGTKIEEIDEMQVLVGKASPALNPIIDFFNLKKSNMNGANLVELCSSSFEIYQGIASFCNILYDLISKTIENQNKTSDASMKEAKEKDNGPHHD